MIDWKRKIQTSDGRPARLICDNLKGGAPYAVAMDDYDGGETIRRCFADGSFAVGGANCSRIENVPETYQERVYRWTVETFGQKLADDRFQRNCRFLEEALELVQANGCTRHDAHNLVDYVFERPIGELYQEVGGVRITLASLCATIGVDQDEAAEVELVRCHEKQAAIRAKQATKPNGSPLPGVCPDTAAAQVALGFEWAPADENINSVNMYSDVTYTSET